MRIAKPEITQEDGDMIYRTEVQFSGSTRYLWYSLNQKYADFVIKRSDAPLLALLIPAMEAGEDIYVAGTISEQLYYNCSKPLQAVLQEVIPSLSTIHIYANNVEDSSSVKADGVATGFSGGIDSFSTLADHYYSDDVDPGFCLTHLVYQIRNARKQLFTQRFEKLKPLVDRLGLPFITVTSNIEEFYTNWNFQQTHTPRRASVALLLSDGIGKFMYSSTFHYKNIFVGETYDIAYTDPITLPLMSTGALNNLSVGSEYTRVEKTLQVAQIKDSYEWLTICVNDSDTPGINCSTCWKCRRTLLTLEIAGLLDRYSEVFDLEKYRQGRERNIIHVLQSDDPMLREIVKFAKKNNFSFPLSSRLLAYSHLIDIARKAKRALALPRKGVKWTKQFLNQ